MKKLPTIKDFTILNCIPWKQIEGKLGKREYNKFIRWMRGQTCVEEGVYECDLENYLEQRARNIKDPIVYD
jgi:hypothetical protein